MFTPDDRERVLEKVLDLARADHRLDAAVLTGSLGSGKEDRWSDIDIAFVVSEVETCPQVTGDWVDLCEGQFDVAHRYEIAFGTTLVRGFLLRDGLELDLAFTPAADFVVWGPVRVMFDRSGSATRAAEQPQAWAITPDWSGEAGFGWHDVVHACAAANRNRPWQAIFYLQRVRNRTLALASQRHGHDAEEFKHVDDLPENERDPLLESLVGNLDQTSLIAAIEVATNGFVTELQRGNPDLAARLAPPLSAVIRASSDSASDQS